MSMADRIPDLDDAALASLRANASRLEAAGDQARRKAAAELLPLIDAEIAQREASRPKPVKKTPARAKAPKAAKPA